MTGLLGQTGIICQLAKYHTGRSDHHRRQVAKIGVNLQKHTQLDWPLL
jgi:hypothetical protein